MRRETTSSERGSAGSDIGRADSDGSCPEGCSSKRPALSSTRTEILVAGFRPRLARGEASGPAVRSRDESERLKRGEAIGPGVGLRPGFFFSLSMRAARSGCFASFGFSAFFAMRDLFIDDSTNINVMEVCCCHCSRYELLIEAEALDDERVAGLARRIKRR